MDSELLATLTYEEKVTLAKTTADPQILNSLASTRSSETINTLVASNPNTLPSTLTRLSQHNWSDGGDDGTTTRIAVAKNPNTPVKTLIKLLEDSDDWVFINASENPSLPLEALLDYSIPDDFDDLDLSRFFTGPALEAYYTFYDPLIGYSYGSFKGTVRELVNLINLSTT